MSFSACLAQTSDHSAFRIQLAPKRNVNAQFKGNVNAEAEHSLTQIQIQRLASHDIVLIIDKSGSMLSNDCPINTGNGTKSVLTSLLLGGGLVNSRWNWCAQQITQMSELTNQAMPAGFTVILFDSGYRLYSNVNVDQLKTMFSHTMPSGGTNLLEPLDAVFADYFRRQKISRKRVKPLLIGIITDGCPDQPSRIKNSLIELTHSLHDPKEITIIFFLIGSRNEQGERFVQSLTNLTNSGASFNLVKGIPFSEVQRYGLARTLANHLE
jgi:hypothetical protein